jgi:type IV pilus assembly protein PilE
MPDNKGFHFIEMLVILVIIGVFTTFSLPLYSHYIIKVRRLEAASLLLKLGLAMEEYHIAHLTYQDATLTLLHMPEYIVKHSYQLIIHIATDHDYIIMAKPLNEQKQKDKSCQTLILHASGERKITGNSRVDECW